MEKLLLFTNGSGSQDPLNWSQDEAILLSSSNLISIRPYDARTLLLEFTSTTIKLIIKNGTHAIVMRSIGNAINSTQKVVTVANLDTHVFVDVNIRDVIISEKTSNYIQTLTNNSRAQLSVPSGKIKSCMIANIDGTDAVACTLELHDGSTYTKLLDQLSIPAKSTLVLEQNEISFDNVAYNLYATSGDANGQLTFTFNYI